MSEEEVIIIRRGTIKVQRSALSEEEQECVAELGNLDEPLSALQAYALAHILTRVLRRP